MRVTVGSRGINGVRSRNQELNETEGILKWWNIQGYIKEVRPGVMVEEDRISKVEDERGAGEMRSLAMLSRMRSSDVEGVRRSENSEEVLRCIHVGSVNLMDRKWISESNRD